MTRIDANDVIELALKLLSIRGESRNERDVADFVLSFCKGLGFDVREDDAARHTGGNAGNVICRAVCSNSVANFLLLNAHLDTVVPTHQAAIQKDQYKIYSANEVPPGLDNRAGVAILLSLLQMIARRKLPHRNFYAVFTVCEDSGLEGSPHFQIPPEVQLGFTFDASRRPGTFIASASAAYYFTVDVFGRAAHAGVAPEKGINAIEIACHAIARVKQGWLNPHTTLNIGTIRGGKATNVIPDHVQLKGEMRSTSSTEILSHLSLITELFKQEARARGGKVAFDKRQAFAAYRHKDTDPGYRLIETAIKNAGLTPQPIHYSGGSDANVFNQKGLPTINIGIGAQNPHSSDEFILIEDLIKSTEIALELVKL